MRIIQSFCGISDIKDHKGSYTAFGVMGWYNWGGRCVGVSTFFDLTDYTITISKVDIGFRSKASTTATSGFEVTKYGTSFVIQNQSEFIFPDSEDPPHLCLVTFTLS